MGCGGMAVAFGCVFTQLSGLFKSLQKPSKALFKALFNPFQHALPSSPQQRPPRDPPHLQGLRHGRGRGHALALFGSQNCHGLNSFEEIHLNDIYTVYNMQMIYYLYIYVMYIISLYSDFQASVLSLSRPQPRPLGGASVSGNLRQLLISVLQDPGLPRKWLACDRPLLALSSSVSMQQTCSKHAAWRCIALFSSSQCFVNALSPWPFNFSHLQSTALEALSLRLLHRA